MLVLTRRVEESVMVGEDIVITILGIEGDRVKLGINAPRDVAILRDELVAAVHQQNLAAIRFSEHAAPDSIHKLQAILSAREESEPGT